VSAALAVAIEPNAHGELDFAFNPGDFERIRRLIHRHAGIALNPTKQNMVYGRLSRRLRSLGMPDFRSYLDELEATPAGCGEWQQFINALTTNLTAFYREPHHFPILAEHIARQAKRGPVKLWSCAASSGEEPCTMAITAMEALQSRTPAVSILATDIDTEVLVTARRGVYPHDSVARLDGELLRRYFLRGRANQAGMVRVQAEVLALIDYRALNLLDSRWPIDTGFDAIFCRNLLIYFDKDTQYRVLKALAARLKPGGLLFAGHSENFAVARDLFELQGRTVYRVASAAR
jgi:chemotaxis protein methyltransferase CheR